jgi:hypothetical protein
MTVPHIEDNGRYPLARPGLVWSVQLLVIPSSLPVGSSSTEASVRPREWQGFEDHAPCWVMTLESDLTDNEG